MAKAKSISEAKSFRDLPNVGAKVAEDLCLLGFEAPADLKGRDAYALHAELEKRSGVRQDPCMLDVFLAIIDFANGGPPRPWWDFTAERKAQLAKSRKP